MRCPVLEAGGISTPRRGRSYLSPAQRGASRIPCEPLYGKRLLSITAIIANKLVHKCVDERQQVTLEEVLAQTRARAEPQRAVQGISACQSSYNRWFRDALGGQERTSNTFLYPRQLRGGAPLR